MLTVEFIYDSDCPNVAATRENLIRAFAQSGVPAKWTEWDRSCPDTPGHARQFGSPAVLVNGRDLVNLSPDSAAACRLYQTPGGDWSGIPSIALIVEALGRDNGESLTAPGGLKVYLPLLSAFAVALLGKFWVESNFMFYSGLLLLAGSSLWNTWPRKTKKASCCEGIPSRTLVNQRVQES